MIRHRLADEIWNKLYPCLQTIAGIYTGNEDTYAYGGHSVGQEHEGMSVATQQSGASHASAC